MAQSYRRAQLSYTEMFTADELTVELDGTTYHLANRGNGEYGSGNSPNSANPIGIIYVDGVNIMYVSTGFSGGDHHVVIKSKSSSIETTECFKKAVKSVNSMMLKYSNGEIRGATWQEAYNALHSDIMAFLNASGEIFPCSYFDVNGIIFGMTYIDGDDGVCTNFYSWNPDGTVTYTSDKYPSQN